MNLACQLAREQAWADGHAVVDVRHLLLVLFQDKLGLGDHLHRIKFDLEKVRPQLIQELAAIKSKPGKST